MYKIEDQVSDSGYTTWEVSDTDREFPLVCSCNVKEDAELIVSALDYLQENSTG